MPTLRGHATTTPEKNTEPDEGQNDYQEHAEYGKRPTQSSR